MFSARILCGLLFAMPLLASAQTAPNSDTPAAVSPAAASASTPAPAAAPAPAPAAATAPAAPKTENNCSDRLDDDGDGILDCADADCFKDPACKAGGSLERSNQACSDFIDNDGNGQIDCDDADCYGPGITVCQGSWKGSANTSPGMSGGNVFESVPDLEGGMSVEDLIGKGKDKDGERNDELCSDGIDNDGDQTTDCADIGCRFDPSVTVCRGNPGMRFSVVGSVAQIYDTVNDKMDTRFTKLQLRSFGPLPFVQDSFYLLSMRMEKTPRLTFAMFQVPLKHGHFMNINSGGGGLSSALIISDAKQLLLDPAYYVYNAFEQGNGAAFELSGPLLDPRMLHYRVFAAGGSGNFTGNVGGRYFKDNNTNYTWTVGGQLGVNVVGSYNRQDTPFLYTPVPTTLGILVGAKYDQRATERYPAANFTAVLRSGRIVAAWENYGKRELEWGSWQGATNLQLGYLVLQKKLMVAADAGLFIATPYENTDVDGSTNKPLNETMVRGAVHYYFYRNIGLLSLRFQDRHVENKSDEVDGTHEQEVRLEAQYRF